MGYISHKGGGNVMHTNLANFDASLASQGKENQLPKTKGEKKGPGRIFNVGVGTNKVTNIRSSKA